MSNDYYPQRAYDLAMQLTNEACGITPNHKAESLYHLSEAQAIHGDTLRAEHRELSLIYAIHADIESRTLHTRTVAGDWASMEGNE